MLSVVDDGLASFFRHRLWVVLATVHCHVMFGVGFVVYMSLFASSVVCVCACHCVLASVVFGLVNDVCQVVAVCGPLAIVWPSFCYYRTCFLFVVCHRPLANVWCQDWATEGICTL